MIDYQQRMQIQIELARIEKEASEREGRPPRPPRDPRDDEPEITFWQLAADLGCQLVGRGYRVRARHRAWLGWFGSLMIDAGRTLRRHALAVAKTTPCM